MRNFYIKTLPLVTSMLLTNGLSQLPIEVKKKKSNFIIKNNFKSSSVKKSVRILKRKILKNERCSS